MTTPQVTEYTGVIPVRTQEQDPFNTNTANLLTWWPTSVPEMNQAVSFVNSAAVTSQSAVNLSETIVSASNFAGEWDSLTGAHNAGISLYHEGQYWRLLVTLANITLSEPSLSNDDYALSAQAGSRVIIQSPFTLTTGGKYYILGSGTVTIPTPVGQPDGIVYDFTCSSSDTPTILAGTDLISSRIGLDDSVIMDLTQVDLIVISDVYKI